MGDPKREKEKAKAKSMATASNVETEEEILSVVNKVLNKVEELSKKVDNNSKTCQDNFKSSDFVQGEISDKLSKLAEDYIELKKEIKEMKRENSDLRGSVKTLTEKVKDYDKRFEFMERQRKKANISIEGVLEIENLPLEKLVNDLLEDLNMDYKAQDICSRIYRKGKFVKPTAGNMPRPRPVIVQFYDESFKYDMFKNIKKMAGNEKWRNVYINDELTADQTNKMKDMRAISGYARSVGKETKIKGTNLIVEGKKFGLDELDSVPAGITIEKAKTIEINGSVIFQGHHSYLSNMSRSEIMFEGRKFNSAEKAFQFKKAELCNRQEEAKSILNMDDPYMAKRVCKNMKETNEWKQKKEKVMKEILEAKFKQNEDLKVKIVGTGNLNLIEGTSDRVWGSGVPIAKYKDIDPKNLPGKNLLGQILVDLRKKLSKNK